MPPVTDHPPVAGLYSSALGAPDPEPIPAASTCPPGSSVAVWHSRGACMLPVAAKVPEVAEVAADAGPAARPAATVTAASMTA